MSIAGYFLSPSIYADALAMLKPLRNAVSRKKRRYKDDVFDLDLAYITDKILAMGFPSENVEGLYRNPFSEVLRFLDLKHRDHFKVYNLCSERTYDSAKFYGRVARYPFDDHNPPQVNIIQGFCEDVAAWLAEHPENVAAVHCKAGKGRTGVMICCYLIHCELQPTAKAAMDFYGEVRTHDGQGVTIPSQVRYIHYYEHLLKNKLVYVPKIIYIKALSVTTPSTLTEGVTSVMFVVYSQGAKIYGSRDVLFPKNACTIELIPDVALRLTGDIKIRVVMRERFTKERAFHFWFNTFFVGSTLTLTKPELDKAHKDRHHRYYDAGLQVKIDFSDTNPFLKKASSVGSVACKGSTVAPFNASRTSASLFGGLHIPLSSNSPPENRPVSLPSTPTNLPNNSRVNCATDESPTFRSTPAFALWPEKWKLWRKDNHSETVATSDTSGTSSPSGSSFCSSPVLFVATDTTSSPTSGGMTVESNVKHALYTLPLSGRSNVGYAADDQSLNTNLRGAGSSGLVTTLVVPSENFTSNNGLYADESGSVHDEDEEEKEMPSTNVLSRKSVG